MVSEKVIVILLIIAIVLSVLSIAITLSVNTSETPVASPGTTVVDPDDSSSGNIELVIEGGSDG
jgi:flagellar basal body-associated protein FliL